MNEQTEEEIIEAWIKKSAEVGVMLMPRDAMSQYLRDFSERALAANPIDAAKPTPTTERFEKG
jgi:hypothetical protein